jgi:hypothetical protein
MHIGPAEFRDFGALVAVRCPSELEAFIRSAGGEWDPADRHWLMERRRVGPLVRNLRRATDPLFQQAGIDLDEGR